MTESRFRFIVNPDLDSLADRTDSRMRIRIRAPSGGGFTESNPNPCRIGLAANRTRRWSCGLGLNLDGLESSASAAGTQSIALGQHPPAEDEEQQQELLEQADQLFRVQLKRYVLPSNNI